MTAAVQDSVRERTLSATAHLLATEGPAGLSVRKIATAAGCSTIAIYHYFGDKAGLLDALYVDGFAKLRAAQASVTEGTDPEADVVRMCLAYRDVALTHPTLYQVMFARPVPDFAPAAESRRHARENYQHFVRTVERWAAVRPLSTDVESAAHVLWAAGHGLVMLELVGNAPRGDPAQRTRTAVQTLVRGLRAD